MSFIDDINPFAARTEGQYRGVDRSNFNVPNSPALQNYFQGQMNGQNSLSQEQLRQAQAHNMAQQQSMAAGAAPGNVAASQLMAMQNAGRLNQGATGQATQAGILERQAGAQGLMGLSQLQQQGGIAYEGNRTARAGGQMAAPTGGEQLVGAGLGVASIAAMANGGVVTQPTHALVGEAGPEAVIPLAKLPSLLQAMQQAKPAAPPMDTSPTARPEELSRARQFTMTGRPIQLTPPPPPPSPLGSTQLGPPAPVSYAPPATWHPQTQNDMDVWRAGQQMAAHRGTPEGEHHMPILNKDAAHGGPTLQQWQALLHGLGVQ